MKALERTLRFFLGLIIMYNMIIPACTYIEKSPSSYSKVSTYGSFVCGALSLIYIILCLCYRGYVNLTNEDNLESEGRKLFKQCYVCDAPKPERAHHCTKCNRCIKKLDHHCHWLGRCINYDNHGHFVRFIFFTLCQSIFLMIYNIPFLVKIFKDRNASIYSVNELIIFSISLLSNILMFTVTINHFCRQMIFITKNITYIEEYHCSNFDFSIDESPYNMGLAHNIRDVLGPFKYLLLGMPQGNGIIFEKKINVQYWPRHLGFSNKLYYDPPKD